MSEIGQIHQYREAILSDFKGDIKKKWYVTFYVWSEKKGELVRKRTFITSATKKERYDEARLLIETINEALNDGQIIDAIEVEQSPDVITPKTSVENATKYFLDRRQKIVGENTIRGYQKDIKIFLNWASETKLTETHKITIAEMPVGKFTSHEVFRFSDYIDRRVVKKKNKEGIEIVKVGVAKKTYSNYIATLRSVWSFLIELDIPLHTTPSFL